MNILQANNYLSLRGGAERVMYDEHAWLRLRGHNPVMFGGADEDVASRLPYGQYLPRVVDVHAKRTPLEKLFLAAFLIYNPLARRRISAMLTATKADLLHCHNVYGGLTTSILDAAADHSIPSVLTLHDYKLACPSYLMLRRSTPCQACVGRSFVPCILSRCHKGSLAASALVTLEATINQRLGKWLKACAFICPSNFLKTLMQRHGYPAERLVCIPNGIDPNSFEPDPEGGNYYLYFGRLSREKGVQTLLRAARGISMPLHVVGDGPDRETLHAFAAENCIDSVRFHGRLAGSALRNAIRDAAFVVVPSAWYENAPMAVLEAMACGKAIVASRIGGIPEQVSHGETGLLVAPEDAAQLHEAIRRLAEHPSLRRRMGKAARRRLEEHFSLDLHGQRLLDLYNRVVR